MGQDPSTASEETSWEVDAQLTGETLHEGVFPPEFAARAHGRGSPSR